ncbi:MAG: hypothetical protein K2W96_24355 [Gemmataceae bacterium]|nr:hypothetical protein [Gemmataceae bacterium]
MNRMLMATLALAAVITPACADDDATPSIKKRGTPDKKFWESVGVAAVKTARTKPTKMEMERVDVVDKEGKTDRKIVTIKMVWFGSATKKKFISDVKLDCLTSDKDNWEVLTIEYTDSNPAPKFGYEKRMKELVKKFNR